MAQLEDLAATLEDIAETAALAASDAFARELSDNLRRNLDEHASREAIA